MMSRYCLTAPHDQLQSVSKLTITYSSATIGDPLSPPIEKKVKAATEKAIKDALDKALKKLIPGPIQEFIKGCSFNPTLPLPLNRSGRTLPRSC